MKHKIFTIYAAALVMMFFTACGKQIENNTNLISNEITTAEEDTTPTEEETVSTVKEVEPPPVQAEADSDDGIPVFEEKAVTAEKISYTEFEKMYEAESGTVTGKAKLGTERSDYSGEGYVTGIADEGDWAVTFELPSRQYYNITISAAGDEPVRNGISVNGVKISEFTQAGSGVFEGFTFKNILLEEGINKVSIVPEDGGIDIDTIEITASDEIENLSLTLEAPALSNPNAGYSAKALYSYLCQSFGKSVILGQYDTIGTDYESGLILHTTGKLPAIRFGDMMYVTSADSDRQIAAAAEIQEAVSFHTQGGIVGYMWNWTAPTTPDTIESIYSDSTDFDLSAAVTTEKIATLTPDELAELSAEGKISESCLKLISDIDKVSEQLKILRDEGAAVLWRPLQEASNGYYWWGCDKESYTWLWDLMYERMTDYHKLDDLIWVWSAQNSSWYVGDDKCDILSVDVYSDAKQGQVNSLIYLQSISKNKPLAMSECGSFPTIQSIAEQRAMWSYIGQWGGSYVVDEEGGLREDFNTAEDLITMYNNDLTITLDKLPDFISLAEKIKTEEEKQ